MIPNQISQTFLNRVAAANETLAVVIAVNGSGLGTFTVQGRTTRTFAFQFSKVRGAHILRFPLSYWLAKKGEVARELFDHNLALPMIPTVETWDATRSVSELVLPAKEPEPVEQAPKEPDTDPAPTGTGLSVNITPNADELAEARRIGGNDFHERRPASPFNQETHPELHAAWLEGFEEQEEIAKKTHEVTDKETVEKDPPVEPDSAPDEPASFRIEGSDIFLGSERVGGLFDPNNHLRMAKGKTDLREQVEAFLASLPAEPDPTDP